MTVTQNNMTEVDEAGELIRDFYKNDPMLGVLAQELGLSREMLLEALSTSEPPSFIVAEDYSLEDDVATVERAIQNVGSKAEFSRQKGQDSFQESGCRGKSRQLVGSSVQPLVANTKSNKEQTIVPREELLRHFRVRA